MLGNVAHSNFSENFLLGMQEGKFFSSPLEKCSDYYGFGLTMPGRSSNTGNPNDTNKFTGHELDDEANLNLYYAGARYLDQVTGRWLSIDPLTSIMDPKEFLYHSTSPYTYALNNPISNYDPNGLWVATIQFTGRAQLGISASSAVGFAIDDNGNIGVFFNVSGGGGPGAGAVAGLEGSLYPGLDTINDLSGWGFTGGAYLGLGYATSFEVNATANFIKNNPLKSFGELGFSVGLPFLDYGIGGGTFFEGGYTFLFNITEAYDYDKAKRRLRRDFGYSGSEADEIISLLQDAKREQEQKEEKTEKLFNNFQNLESGTYIWNGTDWVKKEEE